MRASGFAPEDYADDFLDVWPDNWPAIQLFRDIGNQWRSGMGGPFALDYGVLFHRMDRMKLSEDDHEQMFYDIKVIEAAVLPVINKKPS
jgi:ribosomal protein S18 acetylase RimI-like enzyme